MINLAVGKRRLKSLLSRISNTLAVQKSSNAQVEKSNNTWHTSQLDEFVSKCDQLGGVQSPDATDFIAGFELKIDTYVDSNIDPMSDQYHAQQIQVYEEISGRKLNQLVGEHTAVPDTTNFSNPYGSKDINFISKHSRAVSTSVMLADLKPDAWVLDMGCGWGLTTELIGFTGANVHAFDINKDFLDLVEKRCQARNISCITQQGEFEDFSSDRKYDMIFFYESLHHSTSVLKTLRNISTYAKDDGCIILCGEPITSEWWGSWGVRRDPLSVYCIRKHGWFESGWSEGYIKSVFSEIGWKLWIIAGIGIDRGYIGLAVPEHTPDEVLMERLDRVIPTHWATII